MMNQKSARDLALSLWSGPRAAEFARLKRIDDACRVRRPDEDPAPKVALPKDAPTVVRDLARKSPANYLPVLIEVFRQALRIDGYLTKYPDQSPWVAWQRNRMDARQGGLNDAALKYGAAYARVMPGVAPNGDSVPTVKAFTPRYCTAVYRDPESDEWPFAAIYVDGHHLVLVDEEAEYRFGWEGMSNRSLDLLLRGDWTPDIAYPGTLAFIESNAHDLGFTPFIRFRDRMYLNGEEQFGIVEPLLQVQERIDETNYGMLVAQYFAAFRQRYVLGWIPEDEAEELRAGAARINYLDVDPDDVKMGEWEATDPVFYVSAGERHRRDFASIGQIPAQVMGVDSISNISDSTLAGLEMAKNRKASEIATSLGESYEQMFRLMAHLQGNFDAAEEWTSEVRWAEREARSWAGTIDGLSKLVQSQILSPETAVEMVPNLTEQQVQEAKREARKARSAATYAALAGGQSSRPGGLQPEQDPTKQDTTESKLPMRKLNDGNEPIGR